MGLRATVSYTDGDSWDFAADRIVINAQPRDSPPPESYQGCSCGYGNSVQVADGSLVSVYTLPSAAVAGGVGPPTVEVVRWQLPPFQPGL